MSMSVLEVIIVMLMLVAPTQKEVTPAHVALDFLVTVKYAPVSTYKY
jgi:hypothetical protein